MKFLKSYKIFESVNSDQFFKTKEDIKDWLDRMGIRNYIIHDDLIVDVNRNVNIFDRNSKLIPVQFGKINGDFNCSSNQLTSLKGCPEYVGGNFYCNNNQLTSLEGCPEYVGGNFSCSSNQLISLKGCPESVGRDFYCNNNQLTSLEGCPESVGRDFYCINNYLKDFKGLNKFENLYCDGNLIYEFYKLFNDPKWIKWINEYDVIQGDKIDIDNFKEVLYMLDIKNFDLNKLNQLINFKII